jgi:hypothetical protein
MIVLFVETPRKCITAKLSIRKPGSLKMRYVQSVCKQRLCLHFGIQNIEFYSTTIYIFMTLEYNKLSRDNNQALQEHKMK